MQVGVDRELLERPKPKPYGPLERVQVAGLGEGDYDITLETERHIMTGSNGTGKSTFLKTINAVGTASWRDLFDLPFELIALHFKSAPLLRVKKTDDELEITSGRKKPFKLPAFDPEEASWLLHRNADVPYNVRRFALSDPADVPREVWMRMPPSQRGQLERYRQVSAEWWERLFS